MYSLPTMDKFVRFATNVWDISPEGKTAGELAAAGLDAMEAWMSEELGRSLQIPAETLRYGGY